MNKQKLEEDIKKRRQSPHISNTYNSIPSVEIEQLASLSDLLTAIWSGSKNNILCCSNPKKYKNGIGKMLFWSCKNCGADLGDVND